MNKELQDLAWSVLPKEFKEEVKKMYNGYQPEKIRECLIMLFGIHNLTSDAEGEEMLTVSRKRVQEMYAHYDAISTDPDRPKDYIESRYEYADGVTIALDDLFGSKCLPDEKPKPAEPKFKCEDRVRIIKENHPYYGKIATVDTLVNGPYPEVLVNLRGNLISFNKSDLEPYTEPELTFTDDCQSQCPSQYANLSQETANCDKYHIGDANKMIDNIIKDGFREHNRLHIAAMAMQGILSNEKATQYAINNFRCSDGTLNRYLGVAECSLAYADALINEAEKGGKQ